MEYPAVNLEEKFGAFSDLCSPKIIAQMNDTQFKLVRFQGEFVWHAHTDSDETFLVMEGEMRIDFRNGSTPLKAGEMIVVPKGVDHKPFAEKECKLMLVEAAGTVNTGDAGGALTAEGDTWI